MAGSRIFDSVGINTVASSAWEVVGNGDFDGDGNSDIFWRNNSSGQNWVYLMNGASIESSLPVNTVSETAWKVVAVGDFNDDGNDDLLWRHDTTHQVVIYFMNGAGYNASQVDLLDGTRPDSTWDVVRTGHYNADDKADIVWHNNVSGQVVIYVMDGATITSKDVVVTVGDTNWQIVGTGDYDGDDNADLLWRNISTGQNWLHAMSGTSIGTSTGVNSVPSAWAIINVD